MRRFIGFQILIFLLPGVKDPIFSQTVSGYCLKNKWNAEWIGPVNVSLTDYGAYHFRKTFILSKKPQRFVIHLTGDNRYKLLVNGRAGQG